MAKQPLQRPVITKKFIYGITAAYLIGSALLLLAMTDLFTENPFQQRYSMLLLLFAINSFFVFRQWVLYKGQKK